MRNLWFKIKRNVNRNYTLFFAKHLPTLQLNWRKRLNPQGKWIREPFRCDYGANLVCSAWELIQNLALQSVKEI